MIGVPASTDSGQSNAQYTFDRPSTTKETFFRGSLFAQVPMFMERYLGVEGWKDFLRRVDPSVAEVMRSEFVALAWYPFRMVTGLVAALDATGKMIGKKDAISDMTTFNLDHATRGIFRAVFKLGSPEFMLSRSDHVWRKFYSNGIMTVPLAKRGEAVVRLQFVPDMTPLYSVTVMHSLKAVIVKAGGRVTRAEMEGDLARGDERSDFHFLWT
ncbi:MAG TPA: hypothetical protein VH142_07255 [Polyangiaceae bacterium]|jgi:hypothetical protein|nr:hypothetical protein [Polyangiaceae bacterium]